MSQPTHIRLTTPAAMSGAEWDRWQAIVAASPTYASPYFQPQFTQAVAAVRDDVEIAVLEQESHTVGFFPFQRGRLNLGKPVGGKLSDYHGPIVNRDLRFDPLALLRACRLAAWDFDHLVGDSYDLAPYVTVRGRSPQMDLRDGFAAYACRRREAGCDAIARLGQKRRKLAREIGPLHFTYDERGGEQVWESLLVWKSAQYRRTGLADVFSYPWSVALLDKLRELRSERLAAPLSVLRAGDKPAAVLFSLCSGGLLHGWFTSFNPDLERYSPGLLLLLCLAEESERLGIRTIDLGRGNERYKWQFASSSIEVGEGSIASRSLAVWLRSGWRTSRDWLHRSPLKQAAGVLKPVQEWFAYR